MPLPAADQPPPDPSRAARAGRVRLPPSIDRRDVGAVVGDCLDRIAARPPAEPCVDCDAADVVDPRLPTVDVLAQLALAFRRNGRALRLEHASPELLDLLALCGLSWVIRPAPRRRPHRRTTPDSSGVEPVG